jgi:acyl carrier protein
VSTIISEVTEVMRDVFGDDEIVLTETTTAGDVDGWDSLMHLNLVIGLERQFKIRFSTAEIAQMKEAGQNIGALVQLIARKTGRST